MLETYILVSVPASHARDPGLNQESFVKRTEVKCALETPEYDIKGDL